MEQWAVRAMLMPLLIELVKLMRECGVSDAVLVDQLELAAKRLREGRLFREE